MCVYKLKLALNNHDDEEFTSIYQGMIMLQVFYSPRENTHHCYRTLRNIVIS